MQSQKTTRKRIPVYSYPRPTTQKLTTSSIMPFGKFKGLSLGNIPGSYLLWLLKENKLSTSLKEYVSENKEYLIREGNKLEAR